MRRCGCFSNISRLLLLRRTGFAADPVAVDKSVPPRPLGDNALQRVADLFGCLFRNHFSFGDRRLFFTVCFVTGSIHSLAIYGVYSVPPLTAAETAATCWIGVTDTPARKLLSPALRGRRGQEGIGCLFLRLADRSRFLSEAETFNVGEQFFFAEPLTKLNKSRVARILDDFKKRLCAVSAALPALQPRAVHFNGTFIIELIFWRLTLFSSKAAASVMILKVEPGSYVLHTGRFRL